MTYASTVQIDNAPDAVIRYKQGYCGQCWDQKERERELTPEEVRAAEALEVFIGKRRARLERREREREQFRKQPIFDSININFAQPIRIPMPIIEEPPPTPKPRQRKEGAGRKRTLDYSYEEGTIHFRQNEGMGWCYTIKSHTEEVLAKNEYGYAALKHAKLVAKNEAFSTLGWNI
jgi:hypothetical protein